MFVGGRKINPVKFRENIAYVMQDDALLATATPREALEFSANLRSVTCFNKSTWHCNIPIESHDFYDHSNKTRVIR